MKINNKNAVLKAGKTWKSKMLSWIMYVFVFGERRSQQNKRTWLLYKFILFTRWTCITAYSELNFKPATL